MIFKYEVLRTRVPIGTLFVESCNIKFDSDANIKRAAQLVVNSNKLKFNTEYIKVNDSRKYMKKEIEFDRIKDRIRVYLDDICLGTFMVCSSPLYTSDKTDNYEFEVYDESFIIDQSGLESRVFVAAGTKYLDFIFERLASLGFESITNDDSDATFLVDREFEFGKNVLELINELLKEINFNSIYLDEFGTIHLTKIREILTAKHKYTDDPRFSIISQPVLVDLDIHKIPNVFIGKVSNPDYPEMVYKKVNDDPTNMLSTKYRGYPVTKTFELDNIASQKELENYIDIEYLKCQQVLERVEISTAIETNHGMLDTVQIDTEDVKGLYKEISWEIECSTSNTMRHTLERNVIEL